MDAAGAEDPREIGFNESVEVDGHQLHVQTEVLGRQQLVIRTTVLEGGVVRLVERQAVQAPAGTLEQLRARAEQQHRQQIEQLRETASSGPR